MFAYKTPREKLLTLYYAYGPDFQRETRSLFTKQTFIYYILV